MDNRILPLQEICKPYSELSGAPLPFMYKPFDCAISRHDKLELSLALTGYTIVKSITIKYDLDRDAEEDASRALNARDWSEFVSTISFFATSLSYSDIEDVRIYTLCIIADLMRKYTHICAQLICACSSGLEFATRMYKAEKDWAYINTIVQDINGLLKDINKVYTEGCQSCIDSIHNLRSE